MATESFFTDLNLSTEEAVANFERAIEELERRGPIDTSTWPKCQYRILEGEELKDALRKMGYHVKGD